MARKATGVPDEGTTGDAPKKSRWWPLPWGWLLGDILFGKSQKEILDAYAAYVRHAHESREEYAILITRARDLENIQRVLRVCASELETVRAAAESSKVATPVRRVRAATAIAAQEAEAVIAKLDQFMHSWKPSVNDPDNELVRVVVLGLHWHGMTHDIIARFIEQHLREYAAKIRRRGVSAVLARQTLVERVKARIKDYKGERPKRRSPPKRRGEIQA